MIYLIVGNLLQMDVGRVYHLHIGEAIVWNDFHSIGHLRFEIARVLHFSITLEIGQKLKKYNSVATKEALLTAEPVVR